MQTWVPRDLAAYRGVVFDFDGTLVDLSVHWRGLRQALREYWSSLGICSGALGVREGLNYVESQAGPSALEGSWKIIRRYEAEATWVAREYELGALMACAERGQRLAVFSSNMSATVESALSRLDLTKAVEVVIGGDRVAQRKPHPQGLIRIAEGWRLAAGQLAYVADGAHEAALADQAGAAFFRV